MKKYEAYFILDVSLADDAKKAVIAKYKAMLENAKAQNIEIVEEGNKKLAYPINFKNEGYYVLMTFDAEANIPNELQHQMNLNEAVVRNLIVAKD